MLTKNKQPLPALMMAAIGVVYGDIGTSPLYTLRECFSAYYGFQAQHDVILGFLSLIFWMLILIVSIKYITFVMRADNSGEGGILTLMSLATRHTSKRISVYLILFGLVGASFFYGEVVITPAVSVMSAIEGLEIIAPSLDSYIVPCSIIILTILFVIQRHGTGSVSKFFAPIMVLWFVVIALLGIRSIIETPMVLEALSPKWAVLFFMHYKSSTVIALGATVLAITGVEALYADMGHFGRSSIRYSWFSVVLPALVLNYFGQGALIFRNPEAIANPFFLLAPSWAMIPLLILATLAAVIASQAVIAGVFSLTRQAIHMGFLTPMRIIHTSENEPGQIYIPFVNWLLYIAVVLVVITFKHSSHLAAAYGIAVTGTMVLTGILFCITAYKNWRWPLAITSLLLIIMLVIDIPMFSANALKIFSGGWLPLVIGFFVCIIMLTWRSERALLSHRLNERANSLDAMIASLEKNPPQRVLGTAVYMARNPHSIPLAFVYNLRHNKVLHERVFILTLRMKDEPYVHNVQRVEIEQLSNSFWRVIANYGFKETPNMEEIFHRCSLEGLPCRLMESSFFMSDQTLINNQHPWYLRIRGTIFIMLYRNALRAADQFEIPPDRVIELGSQIEI